MSAAAADTRSIVRQETNENMIRYESDSAIRNSEEHRDLQGAIMESHKQLGPLFHGANGYQNQQ